MTKTLTISIPTWNRVDLLNSLLLELTEGIAKRNLQAKIQVVVSNNGSDDTTEAVALQYAAKFDYIKYNNNGINKGAKYNVLHSMVIADGRYVMVVGDDDRINMDSIATAINILEERSDIGFVLDSIQPKFRIAEQFKIISPEELVRSYYWYMGNAMFFIARSEYFKAGVKEFGYDFFNECWVQSQINILGLCNNRNDKVYVTNLGIPKSSLHGEVMQYTSFYLWRTCYYELQLAIRDIREFINPETYSGARHYLKNSLSQQLFNILQCGIFVDSKDTRRKTLRHIVEKMHLFPSLYEKMLLSIIVVALWLPVSVSMPFGKLAILVLKGRKGLTNLNSFVAHEMMKKNGNNKEAKVVRQLEFEK